MEYIEETAMLLCAILFFLNLPELTAAEGIIVVKRESMTNFIPLKDGGLKNKKPCNGNTIKAKC
jgi:hypothetical protein